MSDWRDIEVGWRPVRMRAMAMAMVFRPDQLLVTLTRYEAVTIYGYMKTMEHFSSFLDYRYFEPLRSMERALGLPVTRTFAEACQEDLKRALETARGQQKGTELIASDGRDTEVARPMPKHQ